MTEPLNKVRIIGGKWRGRRVDFPEMDTLRPTHDRIRETLFSWLLPYLPDAVCLDLFSGSGVIGFESISRGAKYAVLVDESSEVVQYLKKNREHLQASNVEIVQARVPGKSIKCSPTVFDIIFLDPPYYQGLINPTLEWLFHRKWVKVGTLIFIEMEIGYTNFALPKNCRILKSKKTATIVYYLLEVMATAGGNTVLLVSR